MSLAPAWTLLRRSSLRVMRRHGWYRLAGGQPLAGGRQHAQAPNAPKLLTRSGHVARTPARRRCKRMWAPSAFPVPRDPPCSARTAAARHRKRLEPEGSAPPNARRRPREPTANQRQSERSACSGHGCSGDPLEDAERDPHRAGRLARGGDLAAHQADDKIPQERRSGNGEGQAREPVKRVLGAPARSDERREALLELGGVPLEAL